MRGKKHRGEGVGVCLGGASGSALSATTRTRLARDIQMWERAPSQLDGARALLGVTRRLCYVVVGRFVLRFVLFMSLLDGGHSGDAREVDERRSAQ